jgi:hypothetical protein
LVRPALILFACFTAWPAWPETTQSFNGPDGACAAGTPCTLAMYENRPGPMQLSGGPTEFGRFLRLVSGNPRTTPPIHNVISFDQTDAPAEIVIADFDFRITPRNGRADGFGFALLNTDLYGPSGAVFGTNSEEPNFDGSIGVGFDIYQNEFHADYPDDLGNPAVRYLYSNSISIHFNGTVLTQTDVSEVVDLGGRQWIHARVIIRSGASPTTVSVFLTPLYGEPVAALEEFPVPGLAPYPGRVHFGARSGGETAHHDLDNVGVQFLNSDESAVAFHSPVCSVLENEGKVRLTLERAGALDSELRVHYATRGLTAESNSDFESKSGRVTFRTGETRKQIGVRLIDDDAAENPESFKVVLKRIIGDGKAGGPESVFVQVADDEAAAATGFWKPPMAWPYVAVHMHLTPDSKVVYWDRLGNVGRWDPETGQSSGVVGPGYNLFCSGHAYLPDGTLLITGGHHAPDGHPDEDGHGVPYATLLHTEQPEWEAGPDMNDGRWYPTNTPLANGDILVLSGSTINPLVKNTLPQVWQTQSGTWRDLTNANDDTPLGVDLYPRMFLAPDGSVFKAGPDRVSWYLDTSGTGQWSPGPRSHYRLRVYGSAAQYGPGEILIMGGSRYTQMGEVESPTPSAEVIDLNASEPLWRTVAPMQIGRRHHNATVLPDGRVLVTGGTSGPGFSNNQTPVFDAEIWDPETETWSTLASSRVPRLYHSTAMLLPDGSVLSAGGGQGGDVTSQENNAEIFMPPYFFKTRRPRVKSAPGEIHYGGVFLVDAQPAAAIDRVVLVRLPSVTHAFDMNQWFVRLAFKPVAGGLEVTAPANGLGAPPGHYMLFVVKGNGVPSVAKIVRLDAAP